MSCRFFPHRWQTKRKNVSISDSYNAKRGTSMSPKTWDTSITRRLSYCNPATNSSRMLRKEAN